MSKAIKATCLCGSAGSKIWFAADELPYDATFCHCTSCRRMSGCLCVTSIPLRFADEFELERTLLPRLKAFPFSGDRITHYFCPLCGTHMIAKVYARDQNSPKAIWFVMCGVLEQRKGIYFPQHDFVGDTKDGGITNLLESLGGKTIKRFANHPRDEEQLPLDWRSPRIDQTEPTSNKLHARCKCDGIQLWIHPPANGSRYPASVCACSECRLATGMEWCVGLTAEIPISAISLESSGSQNVHDISGFGTLVVFQSAAGVKRGFCGTCGATVLLHREGTSALRLAVGLMDAPEGARAERWLDWDVPSLAAFDDVGELAEAGSEAPARCVAV